MFHWTAALKEEKLLFNFFKRLKFNNTDRYPEFRYFSGLAYLVSSFCPLKSCNVQILIRFLSLCGKERNFVRCDDRPIVFHNSKVLPTPSGILAANENLNQANLTGDSWHLLHNHAGEKLAVLFQPQLVTMVPSTGIWVSRKMT